MVKLLPRPWTLWIFSLIIALLGVYNLLLALDHVRRADYYKSVGVSYPPLLRAGFALAWGVALLGVAWKLAQRQPRSRRWTLFLLSNYSAFGVLWLLIYARSEYGQSRILFQAIVTVILVAVAAGVLRWPRVRRAFSIPSSPVEAETNPGDSGT